MSSKELSDERLNAFIDGELDTLEKTDIFEALNNNDGLRQQACELRQLSELFRHAYERPPGIEKYQKPDTGNQTDGPRRDFFSWRIIGPFSTGL